MGSEVECTVRFGGKISQGKAHLETETLLFRGAFRLSIPFKEISDLKATADRIMVTFSAGTAHFETGPGAQELAGKWAAKICNPRSLIDKLGIKPDAQVAVLGISDETFWQQLRERTTQIAPDRPKKDSDLILLGAKTKADLKKLGRLQKSLRKNGAIWVVWPKGQPQLKEDDVRAAALEVGLVDTKVAKFSESHSALKLVIPVARR
jgi:hypothetical protein